MWYTRNGDPFKSVYFKKGTHLFKADLPSYFDQKDFFIYFFFMKTWNKKTYFVFKNTWNKKSQVMWLSVYVCIK